MSGEYQNVLLTGRTGRLKNTSRLSAQWLTRCRPDNNTDSVRTEPGMEDSSPVPEDSPVIRFADSFHVDALPADERLQYCGQSLGMDDVTGAWSGYEDTDSEGEAPVVTELSQQQSLKMDDQLEPILSLDDNTVAQDSFQETTRNIEPIPSSSSVFGCISTKDRSISNTVTMDRKVTPQQWKFQRSAANRATCSHKTTPSSHPPPSTMATKPNTINRMSNKTEIIQEKVTEHKESNSLSTPTTNCPEEFDSFGWELTDADIAELELMEAQEETTTIITTPAMAEHQSDGEDTELTSTTAREKELPENITARKTDLSRKSGGAVSDNFVRVNLKVKRFSRKRGLTGSAHKRLAWKKMNKSRSGGVASGCGMGRGGQSVCYKCGNAGHWARNCDANVGSKNLGKFDGKAVGFSDEMASIDNEEIDNSTLQQLANESPFPSLEDAARMACGVPFKARAETSADASKTFVAPPPSYSRPVPRQCAVEPLFTTLENGSVRGTYVN